MKRPKKRSWFSFELTSFVTVKKSLAAALLITLACIGCNVGEIDFSNLEKPTLEPSVAIPLGSLSYTMRELIDKAGDSQLNLSEDSTSLIQLVYYDTASFNSGSEIISIEDVVNTEKIFVDQVNPTSESQVIDVDQNFVFRYPSENDEQVDSIFYKSGEMIMSVTSFLSHEITYDISIANTINIATNESVRFAGNLNGNSTTSSSVNLEGYKTQLASSVLNTGIKAFTLGREFDGPSPSAPKQSPVKKDL